MPYDQYNREERALCFHLFRLLHENLAYKPQESGLFKFIEKLCVKELVFNKEARQIGLNELRFSNVAIYPEVALVRDRFEDLKPNRTYANEFMDKLVNLIKKQENIQDCRVYSALPDILCDYNKTHPKQIKAKAEKEKCNLTADEITIYSFVQAIFNAKPDLAITIDDYLLVFEAKFTEKFSLDQLKRTWKIAEIWASDLLFRELGFTKEPFYTVVKLGLKEGNPDLKWRDAYEIAQKLNYPANDRTLLAFRSALKYENFDKRTKFEKTDI